MICDLVKTVTPDGLRLDGALHAPTSPLKSELGIEAVICLHGVGSNFYGSSLFESITVPLQALGLHVCWANTRGHDNLFAASYRLGRRWFGAAFETVDECRQDIAGWLDFLRHRGFQRVGLIGHSLGAIKSVYSQTVEPREEVRSIVAISPPRLSYQFFRNDPQGAAFFEAITTAQRHVDQQTGDQLIHVKYPFPLWITAAGYIEKYGPAERYNIIPLIQRLNCPTLFTYGQLELESGSLSFAGVPDAIRAATQPNQNVTIREIPEADHNYLRATSTLGQAIISWLSSPACIQS